MQLWRNNLQFREETQNQRHFDAGPVRGPTGTYAEKPEISARMIVEADTFVDTSKSSRHDALIKARSRE